MFPQVYIISFVNAIEHFFMLFLCKGGKHVSEKKCSSLQFYSDTY